MVMTSRQVQAGVLIPGGLLVLGGWVVLALDREHASVASFAAMWLAMSIAMMIPTTLRPMLKAAEGSAADAWKFLGGYLAVWLLAGLPAYLIINGIEWTTSWIAAAWLLAGAYQVTPWMQRQLTACRSVRFDGNATRFGLHQGVRCVASCWLVMLSVMVTAMVLPGAVLPLLALVAVTALLLWEKEPGTTSRSVAAVGMAMLLLAAGGGVILGGGGSAHNHSSASSTS